MIQNSLKNYSSDVVKLWHFEVLLDYKCALLYF